ncbi:hypothetical protein SPV_2561 [Streptococcus pneumoniae]|nr:hypothetical protein SPV_2561 [Streptococcus pneumoniae]
MKIGQRIMRFGIKN